jgi:hypothetical protein
MSYHWNLLQELQINDRSPENLPPEIMSVIAMRIEETISSSESSSLRTLSKDLSEFLRNYLQLAPAETIRTITGRGSANPAIEAAYILGQLTFAQLMATQASVKRADDKFYSAFKSKTCKKYIGILAGLNLTSKELAHFLGLKEKTVCKNMARLQKLGITDIRGDGKDMRHFLTPTAISYLKKN